MFWGFFVPNFSGTFCWFPQNDWTYTFRNREFKVNDILKIFLREYVEELFNGYEKYLNIEEIKEYLQKVVNT